MTKDTKKTVHLIYGAAVGISVVVAAVCFIAACVGIYRSGVDSPYTRESIAAAFSTIAVPVYVCIALIIGGIALDVFLPTEKRKRSSTNYDLILRKLREKTDLSKCDDVLSARIMQLRKTVLFHKVTSIVILAVGSVVFLVYALNKNNYDGTDINGSIIKAVLLLAACLAIAFVYALFTAFYSRISAKREIEYLKEAQKNRAVIDKKPVEVSGSDSSEKTVIFVKIAVAAVALVLIAVGLAMGGAADVLTKAVNICTECIGLG